MYKEYKFEEETTIEKKQEDLKSGVKDTRDPSRLGARIKIFGVGGGGNNAIMKMKDDHIKGVEFYVANTDIQVLNSSNVKNRILLGNRTTKGLGAGADPNIGRQSAIEAIDEINENVKDADLVFVATGLGGGTGTGAAPIIAKAAKEAGALVVAIVTTPFRFEGNRRQKNAIEGLTEISKYIDSIIIVSNDRLLEELGNIPLTDSFKYSDAILKQAVRTITDLINTNSLINLDFSDIRTVIKNKGLALIGVGRGIKKEGNNVAIEAAINAVKSPILESSINGAENAIVNIAGSSKTLTIEKAQEVVNTIKETSGSKNIDIIFGITINENLKDELIVSIIATGISAKEEISEITKENMIEADNEFNTEVEELDNNQSDINELLEQFNLEADENKEENQEQIDETEDTEILIEEETIEDEEINSIDDSEPKTEEKQNISYFEDVDIDNYKNLDDTFQISSEELNLYKNKDSTKDINEVPTEEILEHWDDILKDGEDN